MIAVTPRELERERLSPQRFAELADAAQRELGEPVPAGKSFAEYFDQQPIGKSSVLGELRRDAEVRSLLLGSCRPQPQPPGTQKQQYALSTTSLIWCAAKRSA